MNKLEEWIHDDITWCGNECSNLECERNIANRLHKFGMFSMALFKDTETCPLYTGGRQDPLSSMGSTGKVE